MKYFIYATQPEAIAAEAAISAAMDLPAPGINAATGQPDPVAQTVCWAVPQQLADGRWCIPSPDDAGQVLDPQAFAPDLQP
jgi:hypothetical protein